MSCKVFAASFAGFIAVSKAKKDGTLVSRTNEPTRYLGPMAPRALYDPRQDAGSFEGCALRLD